MLEHDSLSDQVLQGVTDLFSRQDPRNPNFQDLVIKKLCFGKMIKIENE
jgi:hypothetical protein